MPRGADRPVTDEERETWHHLLHADSYGAVLFLLVLLFMLPAVTPDDRFWRAMVTVVASLAVLTSLHTSRVAKPIFVGACVASGVAVAGVLWRPDVTTWEATSYVIIGVLLLLSPLAILNRIARHSRVTIRTLLGAIDVYLQLGIAFSFVYRTLEHVNADSFSGPEPLDGPALAYYSFVTLATLGYGDIVPVTQLARNLAVLETIIGQVFLVVVVARVVTMLGQERIPAPADEGDSA